MRTAHLLTWRIVPRVPEAPLELSTNVRSFGAHPATGAFAGLLIGAGNEQVDYRLTALVQQVPAPDGGLLAVVDGEGRARLLDFSTARNGGFSWTLPRDASLATIPSLAKGEPSTATSGTTAELRLSITPSGREYDVRLDVVVNGEVTSTATKNGLDQAAIDGGIALVSHRAKKQANIGWSFSGVSASSGDIDQWIQAHPERAWGPVLTVLYTIDRTDGEHSLNLNALFPPSEPGQLLEATLEAANEEGEWVTLDTSNIEAGSFTIPFKGIPIDDYLGNSYRVSGEFGGEAFEWIGQLRAVPSEDRDMVIGHLNCVKNVTAHKAWNRQGVWFPHEDVVAGILAHDPDLIFCAGDQIYEGDLSGVDRRNLLLDYHTKYQRWLWAFGEVARDRPTIVIPDDHDVFHGNIWGAGGVLAEARDGLTVQDSGGYKLSADVVNAIHRTQVGNLPRGDGARPNRARDRAVHDAHSLGRHRRGNRGRPDVEGLGKRRGA